MASLTPITPPSGGSWVTYLDPLRTLTPITPPTGGSWITYDDPTRYLEPIVPPAAGSWITADELPRRRAGLGVFSGRALGSNAGLGVH